MLQAARWVNDSRDTERKNRLSELQDNEWLGFCGYRYHWSQQSKIKSDELNKIVNKNNFKDLILRKIPDEWSGYEVILGDEMSVNNYKLSKISQYKVSENKNSDI